MNTTIRRALLGSGAAILSIALLTAAMLPIRTHLSTATTALVLVVPVVVGVAIGGFRAGVLSVLTGFLVYDFFFIPPYLTFEVGAAENWAALAVYAIVMIPIARLGSDMISARAEARDRGTQLRRLLDVTGQLIEDRPRDELLSMIVTTVRDTFDAYQVALLLPRGGQLEIAAAAGAPLTADDRAHMQPLLGELSTLEPSRGGRTERVRIALVAAGRPVGLLTISGIAMMPTLREPLHLFANQAALAIERDQLRERAMRAQVTEELARLARMLVAAVAHDLRTPLSSIKAASSILADHELAGHVDPAERDHLASLIDVQADRLAVLVTNLLDMGRVQAGVLRPRTALSNVSDLVRTAVEGLPLPAQTPPPRCDVPDDLPPVEVDGVLITRVLANLLDNAYRHSPKDAPVVITADLLDDDTVEVAVTDRGPGVRLDRRNEIFDLYVRRSNDSGTGLGLAIAKTFVDAHHQRIWVETAPGGGARFCFTLPVGALSGSVA